MPSNEPAKKTSNAVDMSRAAVTARLEEVRALYKLGISLMSIRIDEAKPVEPGSR